MSDKSDKIESTTSRTRRRVVTVGIGLAAFGAASIAFAAFTTNSEPQVPGAVGSAQKVAVGGQVDKALFPGNCENVTLNFTNPNPVAVIVTDTQPAGFSGITDVDSENGNANRLEDFLYQNADKRAALNGTVVPANGQLTRTIEDAVCLAGSADDARQGKTFRSNYFIAYNLVPGNEARP